MLDAEALGRSRRRSCGKGFEGHMIGAVADGVEAKLKACRRRAPLPLR